MSKFDKLSKLSALMDELSDNDLVRVPEIHASLVLDRAKRIANKESSFPRKAIDFACGHSQVMLWRCGKTALLREVKNTCKTLVCMDCLIKTFETRIPEFKATVAALEVGSNEELDLAEVVRLEQLNYIYHDLNTDNPRGFADRKLLKSLLEYVLDSDMAFAWLLLKDTTLDELMRNRCQVIKLSAFYKPGYPSDQIYKSTHGAARSHLPPKTEVIPEQQPIVEQGTPGQLTSRAIPCPRC